jgi:hypothetical protein
MKRYAPDQLATGKDVTDQFRRPEERPKKTIKARKVSK